MLLNLAALLLRFCAPASGSKADKDILFESVKSAAHLQAILNDGEEVYTPERALEYARRLRSPSRGARPALIPASTSSLA